MTSIKIERVIKASYTHEMPLLLSEIAWKSKAYWDYPIEWLESWKHELTITKTDILDNQTFTISFNNEMAGFLLLSHHVSYIEIEHFWILPKYIGKGIGTTALKYIYSLPIYQGKTFRALADPNAELFYLKNGFQKIEDVASTIPERTLPLMAYYI